MARVVSGSIGKIWVPVSTEAARTVLVGSIVTDEFDGVVAIGAAAGKFDTTGKAIQDTNVSTSSIPLGVVVGTNNKDASYDSTYKTNKALSVITSNANYSLDRDGVEGPFSRAWDKQAYVEIMLIGPDTVIEVPIFNAALGTAPSEIAVASGASSTGMGFTTASIGNATIKGMWTCYCRKGLNLGIYRILNSASATVHTVSSPFPYATTVGDEFVFASIRSHGQAWLQLDATGSWALSDNAYTADYYGVNVQKLWLDEAGKERVEFKFSAFSFLNVLA